ncbi:hypothetical protein Bhyg_16079 [Pseudolycoriella hygida]|uniref:CHK kinase-like domain-containing protein n=1 Tax=Pseudolycoriella hygida TaxID=35572 RepID=A0A9Q0MLA3_9DIPT|nr:hypothetical protein Bhyg_16079 [Pseudolycoriella hygida]
MSQDNKSENGLDILPDYLIDLLNNVAKNEGFESYNYSISAGSNHGDGFLAAMKRVTLTGKRNGRDNDKLSLIFKLMPSSAARREQFNSTKVFSREVTMYNKVLKVMHEFQVEKGLTDADGFFEYPKCYGVIEDAENDCYALVMEDLKKSGYEMFDKFKPSDYNHVKLFMESLGKYHALSFALKDQRPSVLEPYKCLDDIFADQVERSPDMMQAMFRFAFDRAIIAFENDIAKEKAVLTLRKLKENFLHELTTLPVGRKSEPFSVINHGDCWNNNLMFKYDEKSNLPQKICLLDWQLARYSSPVLDISYFMFSSTDRKLREEHYDKLIKTYYNSLSNTITKLGSDPEKLFSFNDFLGELKRFSRYGLILAPVLLQIITSKPTDIPDMDEFAEQLQNNTKTVDESMAVFASTDTLEQYNQRVRDVVKDGMLLNYFE